MTTLDPVFEKASVEKIRLYLGTGAGKTTATFGLALRALSKGMNVTLVFFDKLEENSSEGKGLRLLAESRAEGFGRLTMNYTGVNRLGTGPREVLGSIALLTVFCLKTKTPPPWA
jgi:ATP:corrinoid adenosyltransferase